MNIMISYRRADSGPITGRIYDRLQGRFGPDHVFIDIDSIPMGTDFRHHIHNTITRCNVLLPVIGPHWTGPGEIGKRRIDDPHDLVRLEVAHALERNIRVIPLLIGRAEIPPAEELPDDLKALAFRNALKVDAGIDFHHHIDRLCIAIENAALEDSENANAKNQESRGVSTRSKTLKQNTGGRPTAGKRPMSSRSPWLKWCFSIVVLVAFVIGSIAAIHVFQRSPSQAASVSAGRSPSQAAGVSDGRSPSQAAGVSEGRSPSQAASVSNISQKMARVPDPKHFPAGSVGALLVGTWKQADATFLFFEDGTFVTNDTAKGGDEGHWEAPQARHIVAKGIPSHPTRTWFLALSRDGTTLSGRMVDNWGNSEPVTLRRQ